MEGRILASRVKDRINKLIIRKLEKILDVNRWRTRMQIINGPVLKFNSLNSYQWAWIAIMSNEAISSNSFINEFIASVDGTYAQINVESGPLGILYLVSIHCSRIIS